MIYELKMPQISSLVLEQHSYTGLCPNPCAPWSNSQSRSAQFMFVITCLPDVLEVLVIKEEHDLTSSNESTLKY